MPNERATSPRKRGEVRVGTLCASIRSGRVFSGPHSAEVTMVAIAKQVGPSRWRESFGRYYEDFQPGDVYEHRPGRTISETDNTWFTLLTMNTHPLHFDAAYSARTEFGRPLVNSCLTLSIVVGMSVR